MNTIEATPVDDESLTLHILKSHKAHTTADCVDTHKPEEFLYAAAALTVQEIRPYL